MSKKTFGIYTSGDNAIKNNDELIIEIGNSHLACIVKKGSKDLIAAFELFTFEKEEIADFEELFSVVLNDSQLIDKTFANTRIYINNEFSLLVPVFKFNKEISTEYLNIVFGEDQSAKKQFEHLDTNPDLMNVFRMPQEWFNILNHHLMSVSVHHSYSKIVRRAFTTFANTTAPVIKVQFYPTHLIVVVMKGSVLHFIQSFTYQSSEDILYYLLNISQRFEVNTNDLSMQVSGIIDFTSSFYHDLVKYFKSITVEDIDRNHIAIDTGHHPSYYFTPFFNLAV